MLLRSSALVVVLLSALSPNVFAFSDGTHRDLTIESARRQGYTQAAAEEIQAGSDYADTWEWQIQEAHFDSEKFELASARMRSILQGIPGLLAAGQAQAARNALGRVLHAVQDFFSHTNYVDMGSPAGLDLLNMKNPSPAAHCGSGNYGTELNGEYFPEENTPPGKCTHTQLAKDGESDGERHLNAKARALEECEKFLKIVEQAVLAGFRDPADAAAALRLLKGDDANLH